jgi:DCN1-like protein 1/2
MPRDLVSDFFFACTIILCHGFSEPNADMIMVEGISQLCNDMQVTFGFYLLTLIACYSARLSVCSHIYRIGSYQVGNLRAMNRVCFIYSVFLHSVFL